MKYVLSLSIFLFLAACGSDSATNATDEAAMASESAVESSAPSVPAMVEYVWHSKEANFSDEALKEHTDRWAGIVDEAGMDLNYAAVITPRFDNENYDFMWLMVWPTLEARDYAWKIWAERYEADWLSTSEGIFSYDGNNAFGWTPNPMRQPSVQNSSDTGVTGYIFCEYNEGMSDADLAAAGATFNAWVDTYEADSGKGSYWWGLMTPQFELPEGLEADYVWFNSWATEAERQAGNAAFMASGLAETFAAIATCQEEAIFDGRAIYVADSM